jgi:alkylation response protein AidB-like acyl-CoA dehydrogenase
VNTVLSEEQASLESFCRKLLENEWPLEKALKTLGAKGAGHSPELWKTLVDNGWLGLPFSAEYGGADGNLIDLGLIYRAAGERLVPTSFYSCMFALLLLHRVGSEAQKRELMPKIIGGERMVTAAYAEPQAVEEVRLFKTTAKRVGNGWELNGTKAFVAHLNIADTVLVLASARFNSDRSGWGVFCVDAAKIANGIEPQSIFGRHEMYELTLDRVLVSDSALLGGIDALETTKEAFEDVIEQATALQCMEMAGGVSEILKMTAKYVSERVQQGRPIGANQAVQHLVANSAIQLDASRVAALQAVYRKSQGRKAPREVSIAKIALGEAYTTAATTAHQLWGSMGYARETGLYLWSERAITTDALYGNRASHLKKLATTMGL